MTDSKETLAQTKNQAPTIDIDSIPERILTSVDFTYRNQEWGSDEDKINIHAGMEAWAFNRILGLRMGGNYTELTSGFGLRVPEKLMLNLQLDYTFIWPIYFKETLGTHRVSLTYQF